MEEISKNEIIYFLENANKEKINIKVEGYIKANITLINYNVEILNDELKLKEKDSQNYFIFNFNTLKYMGIKNNEIIFCIEDEVDTKIEISK